MSHTVVLFHHVQGLTPGVRALAERLGSDGHEIVTPDFFDGETFGSIDEGFAAVEQRGGPDAMGRWAQEAVADLPHDVVYAGISLGVMAAQRLAQTRPGAKAAVLLESFVPPEAFDSAWPGGLPLQVHGMDADPFFAGEGDLEAATEFARSHPEAEVFTYPGDQHLFTDSSLPSFDQGAADRVIDRALDLLRRL